MVDPKIEILPDELSELLIVKYVPCEEATDEFTVPFKLTLPAVVSEAFVLNAIPCVVAEVHALPL